MPWWQPSPFTKHDPKSLSFSRKHINLPDLDIEPDRSHFPSSKALSNSRSPNGTEKPTSQPLPLPDSCFTARRDGLLSPNCPLPSSSNRDIGLAYQEAVQKSPECIILRNNGHHRQRSANISQENSLSTPTLSAPTKSAPTSPLSSPMISPQRSSMKDIFQTKNISGQGFQARSTPELPTFDVALGFPSFVSPETLTFNIESPTLLSPPLKSPIQKPKSPSGSTSPLHPILLVETNAVRHEVNGHCNGNSSVHPLPLPPVTVKPELLVMANQWQKGKLIGRGTFGSVYVATNRETGALCAMKEVEIFPDDPKSAECIKQLQQEINVLSQLKHPNIVQYYGSEIAEDRFYIYLEYVYPGSINKYVREHCGAITESVVRNFTRHILSGLAYLHNKKTIHRDIKGANLLVDACGVVKLADFGMAKHLTGQSTDLSVKGSPYWIAPEILQAVMQKDNSSDLAFAVDIWSVGCTIIEMLSGRPPWSEYEGAAVMFKVLRESPPIPETLSLEGKEFLEYCFQRNPADRPSAIKLLEHPFLKKLQISEYSHCTQAFNGMTLTDNEQNLGVHSNSAKRLNRLMSGSMKGSKKKAVSNKKLYFL